jgi:hypothetical protein
VSLPPEVEAHLNELSKVNLTGQDQLNKMDKFAQMEAMKESAKHGLNPQNFQNNMQQNMMQQMMMNQMMQQMMNNQMGGNNQMNPMNQNNQNNQGGGEEDIMTKLAKLNKLKEAGLITQEEYDKKKAELLAQL